MITLKDDKLVEFNCNILSQILSDSNEDREKNLQNVIEMFNDGTFDFSINKFHKKDVSSITDWIDSYIELVDFAEFYKSVGGDLTDSYFIKEVFCPVYFVKNDDGLVKYISHIVSSSLSTDEHKELNKFLVQTYF